MCVRTQNLAVGPWIKRHLIQNQALIQKLTQFSYLSLRLIWRTCSKGWSVLALSRSGGKGVARICMSNEFHEDDMLAQEQNCCEQLIRAHTFQFTPD